jgi:hypothetical protein
MLAAAMDSLLVGIVIVLGIVALAVLGAIILLWAVGEYGRSK